ncbi:hypothetical protein CLI64_00985 [Nostoc sp. CENA543]|uniref:hypothetical protein n=1 Tax=Nostoc sp. CENA543 TaxID=1869241 RepID=UPI000CA20560|nr:hypothetical protein [Nostoc sp. CENA543]AUS99087.1 hypothetical protein CLI64_00985 [Nostoc sp. CENA543]
MKKALGLALIATFLATPALAGETFVRNEDSWSKSHTETNLWLNSDTHSVRAEAYISVADKTYIDGDVVTKYCGNWCGGSTTVSYDEYTQHNAASGLVGAYFETNYTNVNGSINTKTYSGSNAHETTAGVR